MKAEKAQEEKRRAEAARIEAERKIEIQKKEALEAAASAMTVVAATEGVVEVRKESTELISEVRSQE